MIDKNYKYSDITHKIIGGAMSVHGFLGNGFQEKISQRALAYEFEKANLTFERELSVQIYYRDKADPIGTRRADFIIAGKVLLETKATTKLNDIDLAQTLNYLRAYKIEIGLLINFGLKSLEFKRLILSQNLS